MEVFIELLSNGDWRAWAALVVGVLLLLLVCYKCILNLVFDWPSGLRIDFGFPGSSGANL